jgi:hypothetical protein
MSRKEFPYKLDGIETNITKRWESGTPHHPEAVKIANAIEIIDFNFGGDSLDLNFGGDGDNGESLLYAMDIYFEAKDQHEKEVSDFLLAFSNSCEVPQHDPTK